MIPSGLFFLQNGKMHFYSISIQHIFNFKTLEKNYMLIEKQGECGVYYIEKKNLFLKYKNAYNFFRLQINKRLSSGFCGDPANAHEIRLTESFDGIHNFTNK